LECWTSSASSGQQYELWSYCGWENPSKTPLKAGCGTHLSLAVVNEAGKLRGEPWWFAGAGADALLPHSDSLELLVNLPPFAIQSCPTLQCQVSLSAGCSMRGARVTAAVLLRFCWLLPQPLCSGGSASPKGCLKPNGWDTTWCVEWSSTLCQRLVCRGGLKSLLPWGCLREDGAGNLGRLPTDLPSSWRCQASRCGSGSRRLLRNRAWEGSCLQDWSLQDKV